MEAGLQGKNLFTNKVLQTGFKLLEKYIKPDQRPSCGSVQFRKQLAINLFFKSVLDICREQPSLEKLSDKITETILLVVQYKEPSKVIKNPLAQLSLQFPSPIDIYHPSDLYCAFVVAKRINHRYLSTNASSALVRSLNFYDQLTRFTKIFLSEHGRNCCLF